RFSKRVAERARNARADEQRAGEPRPLRVRDAIEVAKRQSRLSEDRLRERHDASNMIARRELGDNAAVGLVHRDLRMQCVRKQAALGVVNRDTRFVTGSLEAENAHSVGKREYIDSVYRPCPVAVRLLYLW